MYIDDRNDPKARVPSSMIRTLANRWWQILLLWVLLSVPTAYLIYTLIEPTYEAFALLRVEPDAPALRSPDLRRTPDRSETNAYLLTQAQLLKSNQVLDAALARSEIEHLPMIRAWRDPKAELRKELQVTIVGDNTYLIQVSLSSPDAVEAAAVVNAVVDAYLAQHAQYQRTANKSLKKILESEHDKLDKQIQTIREALGAVVQGQNTLRVISQLNPSGKGHDGAIEPSLAVVAEPQFIDMTSSLLKADFELMEAQAQLEAARLPASQTSAERIRELETHLEALRRKRDSYKRYLAGVKVEHRPPNTESIEVSVLTEDLEKLRQIQDVVKSKLAQLEFEVGQEAYRITVQDRADVPKVPATNRRLRFLALAPVGALVLVLGLFFLGEIWPRRVGGTDAAA